MAIITIVIDDRPYQVEDTGQNLLEACLSLRLNLPYFCWHPALRSAGACRQCAVVLFKDASDKKGRLAMACVTPIRDGLRASINAPEAVSFRAHVIEWLMANHPHDCPVCDEGGSCHLQDMTVMTGHTCRRFRFPKRTHTNQDLGPFISQEMNRCINCYRCVRFYRDYAGGRDFNVFGWHSRLFFGRYSQGKLESPFSGNLVEVCPTGALTDKTLKNHYERKWDLSSSPSICPHCGVGCNTFCAERNGVVRQVQNRFHPDVNGYFLCDRGRFGYEYANSLKRLVDPCVKDASHKLQPTTVENALAAIPRGRMVGIGSPRASIESNFALRELVGEENFYSGVCERESAAVNAAIYTLSRCPEQGSSLKDAETSDAVFLLGEDPTTTAPRLSLSLRQSVLVQPKKSAVGVAAWDDAGMREAVQEARGPFFIATSAPTQLDEIATEVYYAAPDEIARLGFAVAHELDPKAPEPPDLSDAVRERARKIAGSLQTAKSPLIVCGTVLEAVHAAANIGQALPKARLLFTLPECNSFGLALMGGGRLEELFHREIKTLVILENDLYRRLEGDKVQELLSKAEQTIVLDSIATQTTTAADVLLPVAAITEDQGTFLNFEGRAQRFFKAVSPHLSPSWRLCSALQGNRWDSFDGLWKELIEKMPALAPAAAAAPGAAFRMAGQKIPREPNRWSGRTRAYEPTPPIDQESPLSFSMEGTAQEPPSSLLPRYWAPGWNSLQAAHKSISHEFFPDTRCFASSKPLGYYNQIPDPFRRRPGEWLILSVCHVFGTEEISALSPAIKSLAPSPYLAINAGLAERLGLKEGQQVRLSVRLEELTLHLDHRIPEGVALVPKGLAEMAFFDTPVWATIR